jgi:hypothetical protein
MEHSGGIVCNPISPKGGNTVAVHRRRPLAFEAHRQRKKRPLIEFRDRLASLIGRKVRIAQGHVDRTVTHKITHYVQWNAVCAASFGCIPSRMLRSTFSTTTIASSTFAGQDHRVRLGQVLARGRCSILLKTDSRSMA